MKSKISQTLTHLFAISGTSAFWLGVGEGIQFLTDAPLNPLTLVSFAVITTFISYSIDFLKQQRANHDFTLTTLFRPLVSAATSSSLAEKATHKGKPNV